MKSKEVVTERRKQMRQDRQDASSHSVPAVTPTHPFYYGLCFLFAKAFLMEKFKSTHKHRTIFMLQKYIEIKD